MAVTTKNNTAGPARGVEQFLVDNGFVKPELINQLQDMQKQNGQDFSQLLISQKILEEEDVAKAKAAFFNLPYIDLRALQVSPQVLSLIPAEAVNFYNFVPFEMASSSLKVAITDPSNLSALEALEFLGQKQNLQVQLYLVSASSISAVVGKKHNLKKVVGEALKDIQTKEAVEQKTAEAKKEA